MSNRIDIESIEARMRLWAIGDVSDEDLALELDYIVPELKRCYAREDELLNEFQKMSAQIDGLRDILSLLEDRHDIDMSQFKNYFASE